jgi:hypothetical protein
MDSGHDSGSTDSVHAASHSPVPPAALLPHAVRPAPLAARPRPGCGACMQPCALRWRNRAQCSPAPAAPKVARPLYAAGGPQYLQPAPHNRMPGPRRQPAPSHASTRLQLTCTLETPSGGCCTVRGIRLVVSRCTRAPACAPPHAAVHGDKFAECCCLQGMTTRCCTFLVRCRPAYAAGCHSRQAARQCWDRCHRDGCRRS